jgi:ribA/ribD-fused uncharacterized protein
MIDSFTGPYRFLSNFFLCQVTFEGEVYASTEHAYQAAKFAPRERGRFRADIGPGTAKAEAHTLKEQGLLRPDWQDVNLGIMEDLLRQKFAKPTLRGMLLATRPNQLEEGNHWHDNFYGKCYCARCLGKKDPQNHLGKLLMKIREEEHAKEAIRGKATGSTD